MSENNEKQNGRKSLTRRILMLGGVLVACTWCYMASGRYIATDNLLPKQSTANIPQQQLRTAIDILEKVSIAASGIT
jgi:hypothetical protein